MGGGKRIGIFRSRLRHELNVARISLHNKFSSKPVGKFERNGLQRSLNDVKGKERISNNKNNLLKIDEFLQNEFGWTCIHVMASQGDFANLQQLLKKFDDAYNLLKIQDGMGETALHKAACFGQSPHAHCIRTILKAVDPSKRLHLLSFQNACNETVLHIASRKGCVNVVEAIFESIESIKSSTDVIAMLLKTDQNNDTILDVACDGGIAESIVGFITKQCINKFTSPESDSSEYFIGRYETLIKYCVTHGNREDIWKLFSERDDFGKTILHQAAQKRVPAIIEFALQSRLNSFRKSELCLILDNSGNNLLHYVRVLLINGMFEKILKWIVPDQRYFALTQQNFAGETPLHHVAKCQNLCSLKMLLNFCGKIDEHFKCLQIPDAVGWTVPHVLASRGSVAMLENILNKISAIDIAKLARFQTEGRCTIFHTLANKNYMPTFTFMLSRIDEATKCEVLLLKDSNHCTPMFSLIADIAEDGMRDFGPFKRLLSLLTVEDRFVLLKEPDKAGVTSLHRVTKCPTIELMEIILDNLPCENIAELLAMKETVNGFTPLIAAIINRQSDMVLLMLNSVRPNEKKKLVATVDLKNRNALDWIEREGLDDLRSVVIEFCLKKEPNDANLDDVGSDFTALEEGKEEKDPPLLIPFSRHIRDILNGPHFTVQYHFRERLAIFYHTTVDSLENEYQSTTFRLKTFLNCKSELICKSAFSGAGFIWGLSEDLVVCIWCGLALHNFTAHVNASAIHQAYSLLVHCKFLENQRNTNTVPFLTLQSAETESSTRQSTPGNTVCSSAESGFGSLSLESDWASDCHVRSPPSLPGASSQSNSPHDSHNLLTVANSGTATASGTSVNDGTVAISLDPDQVEQRYDHLNQIRYTIDPFAMKHIMDVDEREVGSGGWDMASEKQRQQTFITQRWSTSTAEEWAAAGFFLRKQNAKASTLTCAFCNGTIPNFSLELVADESSAMSLHSRKFRDCPFIQGIEVNKLWTRKTGSGTNIPQVLSDHCWSDPYESPKQTESLIVSTELETLGISVQHAKYPDMALIDRRRSTLLTFPHDHPKGSEELVTAGYFYEGKGYSVVCFFCAIVADDWSITEDVWQRHARSSRSCQFVIESKGQDFIRITIEQFGVYVQPPQENKLSQVTVRMLRPRMDSPVVQQVLALIGEDRDIVRTVLINRLKQLGPDYTTAKELLTDVLAMKVPENKLTTKRTALPELKTAPSANFRISDLPPTILKLFEEELIPEVEPQKNQETDHLEEEMEDEGVTVDNFDSNAEANENIVEIASQMKSQLLCKVCASEVVQIIFLNCGHFVCCTACAAAMKDCPICRQEIKATVRATL